MSSRRNYDGYRVILIAENSKFILFTRQKVEMVVPDNLREQLDILSLPEGTVLDGEIWTPTKRGSWRHNKTVQCNLTFWDAIRSGTRDMSQLALEERFAELVSLVDQKVPDIKVVKQTPANLDAYHKIVAEAEQFRAAQHSRSGFIHGAVLKRKGSPRRDHATRSVEHPDWLKLVIPGMDSGALKNN